MINIKKLKRSVKYAGKGIVLVFKTEQNFRIQSLSLLLVAIAAFYFKLKTWESVAVILASVIVLVLELINASFERMIDAVIPRMNDYVKDIKDIMAATVLIASVAALIIGILIFLPYIMDIRV
ncbi:MAG: diacylglycerol kinase family protein [bacterium]